MNRSILFRIALTGLCALLLSAVSSPAAMPTSGTVTPATTTPVTWANDAVGTGAAMGESGPPAPMEGVNSDTFTLTVAPGDYTGKVIVRENLLDRTGR